MRLFPEPLTACIAGARAPHEWEIVHVAQCIWRDIVPPGGPCWERLRHEMPQRYALILGLARAALGGTASPPFSRDCRHDP